MSKKIEYVISAILNSTLSIAEKKGLICIEEKKRRGSNRQLCHAVGRMLSNHILPIHPGKAVFWHPIMNYSEEVIQRLCLINNTTNLNYFNAVCNEYLWECYHDASFAENAISHYNSELFVSDDDDLHFVRFCISICRIYGRYKPHAFDWPDYVNKSLGYIMANLIQDGFKALFVVEALLNIGECLDDIERALLDISSYYEGIFDYRRQIKALEKLIDLYHKKKNSSQRSKVFVRIAEVYEQLADSCDGNNPIEAFRIVNLIHQSMNAWQLSKDSRAVEQRKRLAKKIVSYKTKGLESMQTVRTDPIDISEEIQEFRRIVDENGFEDILCYIANFFHPKPKNHFVQQVNESRWGIASLCSTNILDNKGRLRCILPSMRNATESDILHIAEHEARQFYLIIAQAYIKPLILIAKEKYIFDKDSLRFIVENNAFILDNRKESFLRGLVAGFDFDFLSAIPILMPQVENAIRCLAEECGAVVYKTDDNGVESCLSLECILSLPEVEEHLDENFIFNLKVFLTSDYGFGMRNMTGHGLNDDDELQSAEGLSVWWFVFRLCCNFSHNLTVAMSKTE